MIEFKKVRAVLRAFGASCTAALLAALPFIDEIAQALDRHLPLLAPYVPADVYRWLGLAVVAANIVRTLRRRHQAARTGRHGGRGPDGTP